MAPKKINNAPAPEVATPPPTEAPIVDAPAPAPEVPAEGAEVAEVAVEPVAVPTVAEEVSGLVKLLDASLSAIKTLTNQLKQAQKDAVQIQKKVAQLEKEKGRRNKGKAAKAAVAVAEGGAPVVTRKPSGFATPAILSKELSDFLGVPEGTKLARTDVTRRITEYVKANSLFDVDDKRNIRTDDKLKTILGGDSDKPLTYFNLQTHIKHHFIKSVPEIAA